MKMSKYFVCCEKCFETIGKRNTRAARLWMDFCAMRLQNGQPVILKTPDFPELRILEMLGFLVSTDQQNCLAVRVNGHMNTLAGEHFFCVKEGRHE